MGNCWTEIGGLDEEWNMKYTKEDSEGIIGRITNIFNGQAINARRSTNLLIKDVRLYEVRWEKARNCVGSNQGAYL